MVDFTVYEGSKEGRIVTGTISKKIKDDEVLIRVQYSGRCGTDVHYRSTDMVLGPEGAGVVDQTGDSVKTLKK